LFATFASHRAPPFRLVQPPWWRGSLVL